VPHDVVPGTFGCPFGTSESVCPTRRRSWHIWMSRWRVRESLCHTTSFLTYLDVPLARQRASVPHDVVPGIFRRQKVHGKQFSKSWHLRTRWLAAVEGQQNTFPLSVSRLRSANISTQTGTITGGPSVLWVLPRSQYI
jgi:hypothetical protein